MKFRIISVLAGVAAAFAIAACSGQGSGESVTTPEVPEPAAQIPRATVPPGESAAPVEEAAPRERDEAATMAVPAALTDRDKAEPDVDARDAKAATEEATRKILDVTRDAAAAITEAGREAVRSVRRDDVADEGK
ncbi:hypothetical protein [Aromatoleum bremense]|uniref:Uncharacterized protein n=1 Tax=Aromatoleum bremense TaxID=76115 RepID=A0ABX1NPY1_9RHOO|nr:hypothetical protein [Aromatoleum bremense]NMG14001.1 hypothetical protein [Aromatoleum bremense]QTQ31824.1 Uncharacterized protein pbN1_18340 [Aromatoleum bremense]